MKIIIDTREQKPLSFWGHETFKKKLGEGDYNVEELIQHIVIERKSLQDLYGSITKGHTRFKDEIVRSRLQGKTFYLFLEGTLKEFYSMKWSKRRLRMKPSTLAKIICTIENKYQVNIIECPNRERMTELIILTLEVNKELYKEEK